MDDIKKTKGFTLNIVSEPFNKSANVTRPNASPSLA